MPDNKTPYDPWGDLAESAAIFALKLLVQGLVLAAVTASLMPFCHNVLGVDWVQSFVAALSTAVAADGLAMLLAWNLQSKGSARDQGENKQ